MSRYYDDNIFHTGIMDEEILHYGVKGMKWRKRKKLVGTPRQKARQNQFGRPRKRRVTEGSGKSAAAYSPGTKETWVSKIKSKRAELIRKKNKKTYEFKNGYPSKKKKRGQTIRDLFKR